MVFTGMLQGCLRGIIGGVKWVLYGIYRDVIEVLQGCNTVTRMLQN